MDLRRGWAGGRGYRRGAARAGACAVALSLAAALCGAAGTAGASTGAAAGTAGASAGAAAASVRGAAPAGSQVAKICAEPSPGAVLATGSHRTPAGAPAAAVRVDQVGYPSGAAKLAEIMTKARPAGGLPGGGLHWVVVRAGSCTVAASGKTRQDLGSWSKRYGWVWAVRFTGVRAPGRYRVGILGDAAAASPWFTIGAAAQLYARPLANALYFYENERDGPDFIHTALRSAPGHLNDLSAMTYRSPPVNENGNFQGSLAKYATGVRINASGGWFDAGDYLHFVETTSYAEAILLQGIASFPRQMGSRAGAGSAGRDPPARTSPARPGSGWTSCSGCGTSGPGRCTTRSAPARRTTTTPATTTSGGCPRPTTTTRARTPTTSTSGTRRCSGPGSPAPRSARTWPAAGRRLRALLPGVPALRPGLRGELPARGRDRVRAGGHALEGAVAHRAALGLLPGDQLAGRHDARRDRTGPRPPGRGQC